MNIHEDKTIVDPLSIPNPDNGDCDFCGKNLSIYEVYAVTPFDFGKACEKHREFAKVFQQDIIRACIIVNPEITSLDDVQIMRFENKQPYQEALKKVWFTERCECCGQRKPWYK